MRGRPARKSYAVCCPCAPTPDRRICGQGRQTASCHRPLVPERYENPCYRGAHGKLRLGKAEPLLWQRELSWQALSMNQESHRLWPWERQTRRLSHGGRTVYRCTACACSRIGPPTASASLLSHMCGAAQATQTLVKVAAGRYTGCVCVAQSSGAWLSLVERTVRDREVGGSNPLAPTTSLAISRQLSGRRRLAERPSCGLLPTGCRTTYERLMAECFAS